MPLSPCRHFAVTPSPHAKLHTVRRSTNLPIMKSQHLQTTQPSLLVHLPVTIHHPPSNSFCQKDQQRNGTILCMPIYLSTFTPLCLSVLRIPPIVCYVQRFRLRLHHTLQGTTMGLLHSTTQLSLAIRSLGVKFSIRREILRPPS